MWLMWQNFLGNHNFIQHINCVHKWLNHKCDQCELSFYNFETPQHTKTFNEEMKHHKCYTYFSKSCAKRAGNILADLDASLVKTQTLLTEHLWFSLLWTQYMCCMKTSFTKKSFVTFVIFQSFMNTPNVTYVTKHFLGTHVFIQHINCVHKWLNHKCDQCEKAFYNLETPDTPKLSIKHDISQMWTIFQIFYRVMVGSYVVKSFFTLVTFVI